MNCWEEIKKLAGRTLQTLMQGKRFDVLDVDQNKVFIKPHSTGNERSIQRKEIEGAWRELETKGQITRTWIEEHHSRRNPAYVAAMLAELPGVQPTVDPVIQLWLGKPPSQPPKKIQPPAGAKEVKTSFRHAASFGKRQEYIAIAELLRRDHDVYMTLVDDQQIDCVIRQEKDGKLRYLDIQIKARSKDCAPKNAGTFAAMTILNPRENYYFIFYSEQADTYWVLPSLKLVEEARRNKSGANKGKYKINLCNITKCGGVKPRPYFTEYENAFHLLERDQS